MNESRFLRVLAGLLMLAMGFGVAVFFGYAAQALSDTFPSPQSAGQSTAVFGLVGVGIALSAMVGSLGLTMIFQRRK